MYVLMFSTKENSDPMLLDATASKRGSPPISDKTGPQVTDQTHLIHVIIVSIASAHSGNMSGRRPEITPLLAVDKLSTLCLKLNNLTLR